MHGQHSEIKKYTTEINAGALAAIEKFLAIAMRNPDSALVSTSDPKELGDRARRIRRQEARTDAGRRRTPDSRPWPRR